MKKTLIVLSILLAIVLIFLCLQFVRNSANETTPAPAEPTTSASPAQTAEPTVSATAEPTQTPDPRNEESVVRAEIENLIRDAKELIAEGLTDDAGMILRDLRTRDLTSAEKEQVDALQASMVTISD